MEPYPCGLLPLLHTRTWRRDTDSGHGSLSCQSQRSAPHESTAFLVRSGDFYVSCFGDVGPDGVEQIGLIAAVWKRVASLIANGSLLGMFLEISYAGGAT
ncbi:hypothetical protein KKG90_12565 [Candidatus Bipolaricaulota bacterium]|nr:hypothetical protein [Candidatus Bipolaricaulota bacterium]